MAKHTFPEVGKCRPEEIGEHLRARKRGGEQLEAVRTFWMPVAQNATMAVSCLGMIVEYTWSSPGAVDPTASTTSTMDPVR